MTHCTIRAFNGCFCPEDQCLESRTVRIPTPPPVFTPGARMIIATAAYIALLGAVVTTIHSVHQAETRLAQEARV